jgi:hypothetical protein
MRVSGRRAISLNVVALMLVVTALPHCGNPPAKRGGGASSPPDTTPGAAAPGKCPDITSADAITKQDFAAAFGINAEAALKLRAGAATAVELLSFAGQIDKELRTACAGIAKDLGAEGEPKDGTEACNLAIKAINDTKAKLGPKAQFGLVVKPPVCTSDPAAFSDCAKKCDPKAAEAKVDCDPAKGSGECGGKCEGPCEAKAAVKCDGECNGACEGDVHGQCGGACKGKCDGKPTGAGMSCAGNCDGKCDANMKGICAGKCSGSCAPKAKAACDGTCTGKCDAEMKSPKCVGDLKAPDLNADCKAGCDEKMGTSMSCTTATASLVVSLDDKLAKDLTATIAKNLPAVLRVSVGLGDRASRAALNGKAVVEGVQASASEIAQTGGDASKATAVSTQIGNCLGDTFKNAVTSADALKANVDVSVNVQASAAAGGPPVAGKK